jgi:hypothetical protein
MRLLDCLVLPIALYGCETWTMNKADIEKLHAFGMTRLRVMFNINWRDHVTNHEIAARASKSGAYIVEIVQHRQHTWLGHVLRMDGNRLSKMSLQCTSTRCQMSR